MLIEIFNDEQIIYMRAPAKPFDISDSAGLKLEAELNPKKPEERFTAIQESLIRVTEAIRKAVFENYWRNGSVDLEGVNKITFSNRNLVTG